MSSAGQQELRGLATKLSQELGAVIARLVPGVHGICVTFAADVVMPSVVTCSEGHLNSDTLLELIISSSRQIDLLASKMLEREQDGVSEHGQDRTALGRTGKAQSLSDGCTHQADAEVHIEDQAAQGNPSE